MTVLTWDQPGQKVYESGVSQGVLYLADRSGVPWNGLTSVEERFTGGSATPLYFEGQKYNEIMSVSDFSASLKAYTYPDEFMEFEGLQQPEPGFYVTAQDPKRFGLSYKTLIGNDLSASAGYKLHILCNLSAVPSNKAYKSNSTDVSLIEFEWTISSIPARISGFRPTSHLILDSTKIDAELLQSIEDILHGTISSNAFLPDFTDLVNLATAA